MNTKTLFKFAKATITNRTINTVAIFILLAPLLFINVKNSHNWGGDFSQYIHQAINIAEGIPQSETGYIFNDQNPYLGPPAYPVGFPILLVPVYLLFGNSIVAFSGYLSIMLILLFFIVHQFFKIFFNNLISLIMVITIAYNPWILRFKASILSDIPFTLFFIASILFYKRKLCDNNKNIGHSVILGLLIGFSMLIKSIGIIVLIGILAENFIGLLKTYSKTGKIGEYKPKLLNLFFVFITTLIFYYSISFIILPTKTEHYSFFSNLFIYNDLGGALLKSGVYYTELIQNFFSTNILIGAFTLTFFIIGFIKKIFSEFSTIEYIFILFILIILAFPSYQGFRYLLPIFPIIVIYIVKGLMTIQIDFKLRKSYIVIIVGVLLLLNYKNNIQRIIKLQETTIAGPQAPYSIDAFNYIISNTPENSTFAFIKPRVLALYTSRKSVAIGINKSLNDIDDKFTEVGVDYLLTVDDIKNTIFENYIESYIGKLTLIWENEKFKLYKRHIIE